MSRVLLMLLALSGCNEDGLPVTPPDFGNPRYYSLEVALRACTQMVDCNTKGAVADCSSCATECGLEATHDLAECATKTTISECVAELTRLAPQTRKHWYMGPHEVECLFAADTCGQAGPCFPGRAPSSDGCRVGFCEDNATHACAPLDGVRWLFDCGSIGARCGVSGCAFDLASCQRQGSFCTGHVVADCFQGMARVSLDCGDLNTECFEDKFGARCRGTGPTCSGGGPGAFLSSVNGCRGDQLVYCASNRESTFDCTTLGGHCVTNAATGVSKCE